MPDYAPAPWTLQQYKNGSWRISAGNVVGDLHLLAGLGNDAELERQNTGSSRRSDDESTTCRWQDRRHRGPTQRALGRQQSDRG
jgi:hypothetical protein